MELILPFWFKQRQGKAEASGSNMYRLTAPNQNEAFIAIRQLENGRWVAVLRAQAEGPDIAVSEEGFEMSNEAWEAAFELYRTRFIV